MQHNKGIIVRQYNGKTNRNIDQVIYNGIQKLQPEDSSKLSGIC